MRMNPNTPKLGSWVFRSDDIAKALGAENGRVPPEGLPPKEIQGVKVWAEPLPPPIPGRRRFSIRMRAACPCGWTGAFGRFHQHVCKRTGPSSAVMDDQGEFK